MDRAVWDSHNWSSVRGRRIEIEPGKPLIQLHCSRCGRDFVEDSSSGQRYAVYVSVFSIQLSEASRTDYQIVARGALSRRTSPL